MEHTDDPPTTELTDSTAPDRTSTITAEVTDEVERLYDAETSPAEQRRAFRSGDVPVAVYGLGKMGLPIAAVFASITGNVIGADVDPAVVERINAGDAHVTGEPGLDELVGASVAEGSLRATPDPSVAAASASLHVIIVPTLLTESGAADLSVVEAVVDAIAEGLDPGDTVFLESTVPPGTTADRIAPRLAEQSGLEGGSFGAAFCPERTSSGRALRDIRESYPKVVGGVDAESTRVAELVYDEVTDNEVIALRDATTAEATKVFGGIYRDVNIALANEFARYADAMGIDVRAAIRASNTQQFSHILSPGPGVGGHCIPVYPHFLLEAFDVHSPVTRIARAVNDDMPAFTVERIRSICAGEGDGSAEGSNGLDDVDALVLGVTYRPDVAELRNSPADGVIEGLRRHGATVDACDPLVEDLSEFAATPVSMAEATTRSYDVVVAVTPHEAFSSFDWDRLEPTVVFDCHDALDLADTSHRVYTLGRAHRLDDPSEPDVGEGRETGR